MSEIIENSIYENIKTILSLARAKAYSAVNYSMIEAYWNIGKIIVAARMETKKQNTDSHY
jgi:hypothetical protein